MTKLQLSTAAALTLFANVRSLAYWFCFNVYIFKILHFKVRLHRFSKSSMFLDITYISMFIDHLNEFT